MKLDPECFKDGNLFFLKASGYVYPCCYVSSNPEARTFLGENLVEQLNVNKYALTEITHSEAWEKLKETMVSDKPMNTCIDFCGLRDKRTEQDPVNNLRTHIRSHDHMKPFDQPFKLYAYKKYDINDISLRVNDNFVLTYRWTHDEIKQIFEGAYTQPGINIKLECGIKMYVVVKKNISSVRFTINTHGGNLNLRYSIEEFESLIADYNHQMSYPVKWDDYDPR